MKANVDQQLRKAHSLATKGAVAEAGDIYREILKRFPSNKRAVDGLRDLSTAARGPYDKGLRAVLALYDQGQLHDALNQLSLLIEAYPAEADLHNLAGAAYAGTGQFEAAVGSYDRAIALAPDHAEAWSNRGIVLQRLQRLDAALGSYDKAIALNPAAAEAHSNRGIVLKQLRRLAEAVVSHDEAIRLKPGSAEAHYNRGNALHDLQRLEEAVASYDAAIRIKPDYVLAWSNRGNALKALRRLDEALASYDAAIRLRPDFAVAHSNRGVALLGLERFEEALDSCMAAVGLQPDSADIHYNAANVLQEMQRPEDAIAHYDAAILLRPGFAEAHANRGNMLYALQRLDEAASSYRAAIACKPDDATGHYNLGNALQELQDLEAAVDSYRTAITIRPGYAEAQSQLLYQQARMCRWDDSTASADLSVLGIATNAVTPFTFLAIEDSARHHLQRAQKWVREKCQNISIRPTMRRDTSSRIRIGYFSADFHNHATMYLMARLFELHDRSRFEIHIFSYGPDRQDNMRQRVADSVDGFHDVAKLTDKAIADLARSTGIDIAIDLKGHTKDMRLGIFSHRAAPVQINYLGYPGSSGADFIDYIIADDVVIPERSRQYYSEKVISLPFSYQVNDDARTISDRVFTRRELELPEDGFVFCSFNNNYKITPAEYDIWMRLLSKVDGSVLWLLNDNRWAQANLRKAAEARGVDPDRLIFAERMALPDHLARHRCADLFLDSFNCNAHTTASDALWAGLPVLTKLGESFTARVAGSLLHAIGMPDLVTETPAAYERIALGLATDPARLADTRARLAANRLTTALFDTERYARDIERAFDMAHDRYLRGLQPDHFKVPVAAVQEKAAA
ncbi:Predicted O-linked N-acetylglucosamine transferase, SPINDLY family [Sphingomonas sp. YR710]|uniref:tetratricopeptide repeat protein n=1 Tax=Sphingomonas sp. YR710 TaxID=1882773 RepID=UPI0008840EA5|nr:tetratricopeptide repeat protein [Sphingomonas sp. YR710]SDD64191.1 Predicted O-linked N-acetylglucosamine transferase, SPINDLY family [Sphingomonas sp. YR710]